MCHYYSPLPTCPSTLFFATQPFAIFAYLCHLPFQAFFFAAPKFAIPCLSLPLSIHPSKPFTIPRLCLPFPIPTKLVWKWTNLLPLQFAICVYLSHSPFYLSKPSFFAIHHSLPIFAIFHSVFCHLLAYFCHSLIAIFHLPFKAFLCQSPLAIRHWPFAIRHSPFAIRHSPFHAYLCFLLPRGKKGKEQ